MRNRTRHCLFAGAAAVLVAVAVAHAQRLNLDSPSAPAPGSNDSTRAMRASLRDAAIGGTMDALPTTGLGAAARARTQALALALIKKGEELGEPGSVHLAAAMTLLADMSWPSELGVLAAAPVGDDAAAALRTYIRAIDAMLGDPNAPLPNDSAALDVALRNIFAPLTEMSCPDTDPLHAGWVAADAARLPPSTAELRAAVDGAPADSIDSGTGGALLGLLNILEEADSTWSFAAAAADARATIASALPPLTGTLPAWFAEARRGPFVEQTSAALRAFAATTRDDEAAATLNAAAAISGICAWADGLATSAGQTARDIQSIRLAIADAAADAVGQSGPPRDRARKALAALSRTIDLLNERAAIGTDADVTQSLRTSFRALDAAAKKSEAQLVAQIAEIARADSATSQPAIVSAIASHRRSLDDLKMLRLVDELLTRHKDDQSPTWRLVTSRLTRVGQEVAKPATMETALLDLRAFAAAMELQEPFAGEPAIRAAGAAATPDGTGAVSAWDSTSIKELTGNKAAALVTTIDELRTAYLEAWSREGDDRRAGGTGGGGGRTTNGGQDSESIASRLRVLRMVCAFIEDVRVVRALAAAEHRAQHEGLMAWRGLPISAAAAAYLGGGEAMSRAVSETVTQSLDQSPAALDRARTNLRRMESANATLRLVARLDRESRERGIIAVPPYASLAAIPTRGAWMVEHRNRLAAIAHYLDEAAAAAKAGSSRDADKIMAYVDMVAGEVGK